MCIPLFLFIFYWLVDNLKLDDWIDRYSNHWGATKIKAFLYWFLLLIFSFIAAVMSDYPVSYELVTSLQWPSLQANGIIVVCWGIFTVYYLLWYLVIWLFRENFVGVERVQFMKWWLKRTFFLRKMCLFVITVIYMPASRFILLEFYCVNGGLYYFPEQACFPNSVSLIQYFCFVFGFLYIVGIPYFFYRLIDSGVDVVSKQRYNVRAIEVQSEIVRLEGQMEKFKDTKWKKDEYKKSIDEYKEYIDTLWTQEVIKNPLPQTYLFAAYERRFRYYKILQMFQKLYEL